MRSPLLLDTHALLWVLIEPARIPEATMTLVRDPATELLVSAASAWEIATKYRLGKLDGAEAVVHGYDSHLTRLGATDLPVTGRHALTAGTLNWDHRDPFDRMIVAQAIVEAIPVVSADRALRTFPGITTVWWRSAGRSARGTGRSWA